MSDRGHDTRAFSIVTGPDDVEPPAPHDDSPRALERHATPGLVPVVTVSRQIVSATVTMARPSTGLAPRPAPLCDETAAAEPRVTAPRIDVDTQRGAIEVDPRLVMITDTGSAAAATFRSLRQRVIERGDPRVVLVTSAAGQEGSTTCAANLALAFAELRRHRVLLVEADVRRPAIARLFGIVPRRPFLAQIAPAVRDDAELAVVEVEGRGLHVAALEPGEQGQTLDGPAFRAAIERLRRAYDYVIIDGPSVLAGPEVNLIEDAAEAVVLAARSKRSRGRQLRGAIDQIAPANLLGVVLMDG